MWSIHILRKCVRKNINLVRSLYDTWLLMNYFSITYVALRQRPNCDLEPRVWYLTGTNALGRVRFSFLLLSVEQICILHGQKYLETCLIMWVSLLTSLQILTNATPCYFDSDVSAFWISQRTELFSATDWMICYVLTLKYEKFQCYLKILLVT